MYCLTLGCTLVNLLSLKSVSPWLCFPAHKVQGCECTHFDAQLAPVTHMLHLIMKVRFAGMPEPLCWCTTLFVRFGAMYAFRLSNSCARASFIAIQVLENCDCISGFMDGSVLPAFLTCSAVRCVPGIPYTCSVSISDGSSGAGFFTASPFLRHAG